MRDTNVYLLGSRSLLNISLYHSKGTFMHMGHISFTPKDTRFYDATALFATFSIIIIITHPPPKSQSKQTKEIYQIFTMARVDPG